MLSDFLLLVLKPHSLHVFLLKDLKTQSGILVLILWLWGTIMRLSWVKEHMCCWGLGLVFSNLKKC